MGRLLKKKDGAKQKKKKLSQVSSTEATVDDATTSKPGSPSGAPTAIKKASRNKTIPVPKAVAASKGEKNFLEKSIQFLKEVKVELKKVTWPSKKQTIGSTAVVILVVMIISMLLGVMDIGLSSLVKIVLQ
jgi:preprotein translocase subunit SecE